MGFSKIKAQKAQYRESNIIQLKEKLKTSSRSKITIYNYLGWKYFFTAAEALTKNTLNLIENKYTRNSILPCQSDVKDGLIKMVLYSNLSSVEIEGVSVNSLAVLRLTSDKFIGSISSKSAEEDIIDSFSTNNLSKKQTVFAECLFKEAVYNNFLIEICGIKE
ncbi:MAG: hypothetical protein LBL71_01860 [Endomicrobium sp.]|jgi:hypothetical protein|nr:hypothetical protein [Endomicrobium sp.]